ncbi:hypothetical protein M4D58_17940 [Brevibacillus borstelensis]|uniref:hypothetical protein n=1 Tax=Brevibacillus borstelensis TaxID=45462 RepID=UPI00203EC08A|nr:hypothetical protein [Brevibacillus borstelensis]MCM3592505.1 hypothetical protein [Brevibacillus borstelensis]
MDKITLITMAAAEAERLAAVVGGTVAFDPSDYRKLRELATELQRQDDANLSLYGRKVYEVYRHVEKYAELRKSYPANSRPVRKVCEAAAKTLAALERIGERIVTDVYRKAGAKYGV